MFTSDKILIGQTNTIYPGANTYGADAFDLIESAMPAATVFFPKAFDNLLGSSTGATHLIDNFVYVQNLDSTAKSVKIEQFNNNGAANGYAEVALAPNATHVFRPKDLVTDGTGSFRGSVRVTERLGRKITGAIKSLIDKRSKLTLIATQNAPALEYAVERPHGMTAWVIDHTGPVETPQALGLARKWNGPYKAAIDVKLRIHESEFTLTYELRANDPNLYLHLTGTWFQRGTPQTGVPVLALAVPLQLTNAEARYEIPFGALERPGLNHGEEVPALRWAQVTGKAGAKSAGCLLLNDSKHGHSLNGSTLRLTLIRGSYDPDPLPEIGRHEVHLALQPFSGAMPVAEAIRQGIAFNHALRIMGTDIHDGTLPTAATFASAKPESAILITVKKAEDDDALILRFFDPTGKATVATATLDRLLGKVTDAVEVDLLERPTTKSTAKTRGNTVSVKLPARGIASVKVRMGK